MMIIKSQGWQKSGQHITSLHLCQLNTFFKSVSTLACFTLMINLLKQKRENCFHFWGRMHQSELTLITG